MKIIIGCDHAALCLKNELLSHLAEGGHQVTDVGTFTPDSIDYPDYARPVCEAIQRGEFDQGILLCGTGLGMSIAANKFKQIRCALCSEPFSAKMAREHNNTNVIAMGARVIGVELAKMILDVYLSSEPAGGNHSRRIAKIESIEQEQHLTTFA